ncbi:MAG: plasmid pRiA4b ORF-3 family protein, partial [Anaerolineales bacterium]
GDHPMPSKTNNIYQLKISLKGAKPPIWRRVLVPANFTLHKLHKVIQAAMGWWDYHLHQFIIFGEYYSNPADDGWGDLETKNEQRYRLNQIVSGRGFKFEYEYDFGDSWAHVIQVEKILPREKGVRYPVCIKGKRACPPEDVGGIWGYAGYLEAIQDPKHPEHDDYLEWRGPFDPNAFDLDEVNAALQEIR